MAASAQKDQPDRNQLVMAVTAKTYRYLGEDEIEEE